MSSPPLIKTRPYKVLPLLLTALVLSACSAHDEGPHLAASRWDFALIDGQQPLSDAADMRFEKGSISVLIGCNRIHGPWRLSAGRLVAGPLVQTEMACPAPAWDQEKAINALLAATPRVVLTADHLILQSGGHTAELVRSEDD